MQSAKLKCKMEKSRAELSSSILHFSFLILHSFRLVLDFRLFMPGDEGDGLMKSDAPCHLTNITEKWTQFERDR